MKGFIRFIKSLLLIVTFSVILVSLFGPTESQKEEKNKKQDNVTKINKTESISKTESQKDEKFERGEAYKVFVSQLNVREKPSAKSKVIYKLSCSDVVYDIKGNESKKGNWMKIIIPNSNSKAGWVSDKYLVPESARSIEIAASIMTGIWGLSLPAANFIDVSLNHWTSEGMINDIQKFNVTVRNKSCFYFSDPVFHISEYGESGTKILSEKHIEYIKIPPYGKRTVKFTIFGHPQAKKSSVKVIDGKFKNFN